MVDFCNEQQKGETPAQARRTSDFLLGGSSRGSNENLTEIGKTA